MSALHDPDRTVVDAFLVKSQFRPGSVPTYRWFLRTFEDVARRHPAVDRQMLEAWLKEMARRWRMSTLLNQVCIVDRFLDHLAEIGLNADNPIVALRRRYHVKHSKPISTPLASPTPDEELHALRQPAPFRRVLRDLMRHHVALLHTLG